VATTLTSYDGGVVSTPRQLVSPRSVEEIQAILRDPERYPSPVRAVGSFHSLTPCAASPGTMVRMGRLRAIQHIDRESMTLTAQAGIESIDAAAALRAAGLQFRLNPEIGNMTLGSAACCHSKDSLGAVDFGQASSYVTRVKWVSPSGELHEVSEEDDPGLLSIIRSSHGLGGIVYEVTFRIQPLQMIQLDYQILNAEDLRQETISQAIAANESLVFWTIGRRTVIQTRNAARRPTNRLIAPLRRMFWSRMGATLARGFQATRGTPLDGSAQALWRLVEQVPYRALSAIGGFSLHEPDKMIDYRRTPSSGRYAFTFWAFPRDEWVANLRAYLEFSEQHERQFGFRCNLPLGSYYIRHDTSSLLSYSHGGDIISIDPIHAPTRRDRPAWDRFLRAFNDWAHARGGIPLLNQSPHVTREQVSAAYGARWEEFSRWVHEVDPDRRMLNPFFAELLEPAAEAESLRHVAPLDAERS
jgi:FAD/FMN-containing dehydrogenase